MEDLLKITEGNICQPNKAKKTP